MKRTTQIALAALLLSLAGEFEIKVNEAGGHTLHPDYEIS